MRYVISMVFAAAGFALAAYFLSSQVADWVVNRLSFESPDDADSLHMAVWIGFNVVGMLIGWLVGWVVGTPGRSSTTS
jgi:hypothetical protein